MRSTRPGSSCRPAALAGFVTASRTSAATPTAGPATVDEGLRRRARQMQCAIYLDELMQKCQAGDKSACTCLAPNADEDACGKPDACDD